MSSRPGVLQQVLLYLPNRFVDLLDIVKLPLVGADIAAGLDLRVTRWGQLALQAGAGAGIQWDGRSHSPWTYNVSATAAFGPFRTGEGEGDAPSIGDWEIAVALPGAKAGIDLEEMVDFALGWFFIDIRRDDYGWR